MTLTATDVRQLIESTPPDQLPALTDSLTSQVFGDGVETTMTVAEVSELVGVSAHTLRYYERIGLVEVARDAHGYRCYDRSAVGRIVFVTRLRLSDMPIRDIKKYVDLVNLGPDTVPDRLALLERHRDRIRQQIADLEFAEAVIDYKITTYGGNCSA
ncbi:MerR family transcriptional regulator [Microlunatus sp. GCM10028923]|uniref:MerR family transcriptional regulator n=1 Tax=Microlunatus sp. GCM10028923 TaxID=3273400 RepID=UPI00360CD367